MYTVITSNPVSEYVVVDEAVSATRSENPPPIGDSRSILYPVIGEPPSDGAFHDKSI